VTVSRYVLEVVEAPTSSGPSFKARLRDEAGEVVGESGIWRDDPRVAAVNAVSAARARGGR
jgi:hypothetical protein